MKRFLLVFAISVLFASASSAQNIVTPVYVLKDGDATPVGYSGSGKEIYVNGGSEQSVGWIMFQTQGIDMSKIASAKMVLYVNSLINPGTLQVRLLTTTISAPENNVRMSSIAADVAIADTLTLGTDDVEKVIQIDLTAAVKSGTFKGVVLMSDDGLSVTFDSKEGHLAPVVLLTSNVDDVAAKWHSGSGAPAVSLGKDNDYYLNRANGDVFAKTSGIWSVVTNITGPTGSQGLTGEKGDQGVQGLPGSTGPQGIQGLKGDKGDQGAQGLPGSTGLQGIQGPKGDNGSFPSGTHAGDMQYWNGSQWIMIPAGAPGQVLNQTANSIPMWANPIPSFICDIDKNIYHTITIGTKTWLVENLRTTKYNDGTAIPLVTDNTAWNSLTTAGYCWYSNDTVNKAMYGALYNWYAVNTGKLAPTGWHVATDAEWDLLTSYLGENVAGGKLKEAGLSHWNTPNTGGTNETGFCALPGGYRTGGSFYSVGLNGYWWSSTENVPYAFYRNITNNFADVARSSFDKKNGASIRCVRD